MTDSKLTIAVSKGRILEQSLPLLAKAGVVPIDDLDTSRKLRFETKAGDVSLLVIRAADVPTYVAYGAADLGIAGKDVLMEHDGAELYEPLDLKIARCRLCVAGKVGESIGPEGGRVRVATKYLQTAKRYFGDRGQQAELIKLYGSMELAPLVGLADLIVDLVDTGGTLKANGLVELETIAEISSRLVVNKASMKTKHAAVTALMERLAQAVAES